MQSRETPAPTAPSPGSAATRIVDRISAACGSHSVVLAAFAFTIFVSALLLFSVQPMYARIVLPKLGGSPSVWAVSMCVFQALLLAGYCYAHLLIRAAGPVRANLIHLAVMAAVALALPIGLPSSVTEPTTGDAYLWLIGVLLVGVGLPFFAISANAPLIQAWFAETRHPHARDPYFLYAASNVGSLSALLAYPLLVEPSLGLGSQTAIWSTGFLVLAALIAVSGALMRRAAGAAAPLQPSLHATAPTVSRITASDRLVWIALALIPSALVVAVTTYITTDIASAPFLWVVPLALFLLTFILVFRDRLPFNYTFVRLALPISAPLALISQISAISGPITILLPIVAFFLASVVCHRELYLRRPEPRHLTEFYLFMSLGGVLGGIFSALIAPHVFKTAFEFPLLIFLSLLCLPGIVLGADRPVSMRRMALIIAGGAALLALHTNLAAHGGLPADESSLAIRIALLVAGLVVIRNWPEFRAAAILAMIAGASYTSTDLRTIHSVRGFFGTHRVMLSETGDLRTLSHGTTIHGKRRLLDEHRRPIDRPVPATYYHADGPMARGVGVARANLSQGAAPMTVGIVGLGAGSIACFSRPDESWKFFEIDPLVVEIARNPRYFDFMARCQPSSDIVIGDARLTLAKEPHERMGYLLIDAFSSDAIPVHLLTAEALRLYASLIDERGLIAIHISNRYLDLVPTLAATIAAVPGLVGAEVKDLAPRGRDASPSHVVFIARDQRSLEPILAWKEAKPLAAGSARAWTDDYSNLLAALFRRAAP